MTHASVFSGIGGPEVAATLLGWENLFHCEINPFGRRVLDYWYPNAESYDDITKTDFTKWRGRVNVLTGGFPCQPFSYAGKRKGEKDDRYLWPSMYRAIDEIKPDWVVAENVAGILTMVEQGSIVTVEEESTLFDEDNRVHRYQFRETFTLERICQDLETHGYSVQPILIPACAVEAPHRRDRVFIVAHACGCGQSTSEQQGERTGQTIQREIGKQSLDGTGRLGVSQSFTDSESTRGGCLQGDSLCSQSDGTPKRVPSDNNRFSSAWIASNSKRDDVAGQGRWNTFPTITPIHRRNDGLPFDVDNLAIPFNKWRTQSLKAYGNAIVPQVMYEIFRAIEFIEKNKIQPVI